MPSGAKKQRGYTPATHQETNCRRVSYENEISRPNATARGVGAKVIPKSLSRREKSARADGGNIFRYLLILEYLPRILLFPLGLSLFLRFLFFSFSSHLHTSARSPSYVRSATIVDARQHRKRFCSLESGSSPRISNIKYAFEIKKQVCICVCVCIYV